MRCLAIVILITGASSGIGAACAVAFAKLKRDLFLVARRKDRLDRLAADLKREHGVRCETAKLDVSNRADVEHFAEAHSSLLCETTVLINNAGLARGFDTFQEGKIDDWDEMIGANVRGLLYVTRQVLPGMVKQGRGHVVNLGSVAGRWVYPKGNVYSATKRAVSALTEGLRLDLCGTGIRVSEVSPGMVETEFSEVRFRDAERGKSVYQGVEPLTPEDIAEAVVWCVTRPARMNVQELVIYATAQASTNLVARKT
jgi:3-hydroxy acid dehydrogenase/malonic semialdehyde reductase